MTLEGHIKNGQVVLDEAAALPEGAKVRVEVLATEGMAQQIPSPYERLKPIIGTAEGLLPDFAAQHDHYIRGTPKR